MADNRRRISTGNTGSGSSGAEFDRTARALEEQLRLQQRLVTAERERQLALEKTRREQEAVVDRSTTSATEAKKAFTEMSTSADTFVSSTGSGVKSLFRSVLKGEINSAKDLWESFCSFLTNAFLSAASRMVSSGFKSMFSDLFGSFFGSSGEASAQSGLSSSAGTGGSQKAAGSGESMNVEVRIDNQSSVPIRLEKGLTTRNLDKWVVGVVAKDIAEYGELGKLIRNRKQ